MLGIGYDEIEMLARSRVAEAIRDAERRRMLVRPAREGQSPAPPRRVTFLRWIPRPSR